MVFDVFFIVSMVFLEGILMHFMFFVVIDGIFWCFDWFGGFLLGLLCV